MIDRNADKEALFNKYEECFVAFHKKHNVKNISEITDLQIISNFFTEDDASPLFKNAIDHYAVEMKKRFELVFNCYPDFPDSNLNSITVDENNILTIVSTLKTEVSLATQNLQDFNEFLDVFLASTMSHENVIKYKTHLFFAYIDAIILQFITLYSKENTQKNGDLLPSIQQLIKLINAEVIKEHSSIDYCPYEKERKDIVQFYLLPAEVICNIVLRDMLKENQKSNEKLFTCYHTYLTNQLNIFIGAISQDVRYMPRVGKMFSQRTDLIAKIIDLAKRNPMSLLSDLNLEDNPIVEVNLIKKLKKLAIDRNDASIHNLCEDFILKINGQPLPTHTQQHTTHYIANKVKNIFHPKK